MVKLMGAATAALFLVCNPACAYPTHSELLSKTFKVTACEHTGSAVAISSRRLLTNHHVIEGCDRLSIDGISVKAIADDEALDLVVLEVPATKRLPATARISRRTVVAGDPVFACGSPFGMRPFCTEGHIGTPPGPTPLGRRIISTAPIAPGNSGGPLFNDRGEVVGINQGVPRVPSGGFGSSQDFVNIGLVIPADIIRKFLGSVK